jgi:hypothetical protein
MRWWQRFRARSAPPPAREFEYLHVEYTQYADGEVLTITPTEGDPFTFTMGRTPSCMSFRLGDGAAEHVHKLQYPELYRRYNTLFEQLKLHARKEGQ